MTITANKLVNKVLRRCGWPADANTGLGKNAPLSDADLLELADEEIAGQLKSAQLTSGGAYDLMTLDYPITAGQTMYRLPAKCFGPIQDFIEVQTDTAQSELSMPVYALEDVARPERMRLRSRTQYIVGVDGDYARIYPPPTITSKTLRIRYFRSPNKLALLATCGQITSRTIDPTNDTLLLDTDLFTLYGGTKSVDVIGGGNAHQVFGDNVSAALANIFATHAAIVTVAAGGWDARVSVGDYVAPTGTTPIAQIPEIMETLVVLRTAAAALWANGQVTDAQSVESLAKRADDEMQALLKPRVAAEPDYIVTRNSPLRSGSIRGRIW